jgi:outer membrane biogenesis lipoprotein LolB
MCACCAPADATAEAVATMLLRGCSLNTQKHRRTQHTHTYAHTHTYTHTHTHTYTHTHTHHQANKAAHLLEPQQQHCRPGRQSVSAPEAPDAQTLSKRESVC